MLRVLIADDHEMVRRGLKTLVQGHHDWELCGEAADGQEALDLAIKKQPNVVVLDVSMPTMNGLAVARRLRQDVPNASVMFFTMHDEDDTISAGLASGARGYVLKSDSAEHVEAAIASLGARKPYFTSAVSELLLAATVNTRSPNRLESFTTRELEIAQLIAEGKSNKQIARHLQRSIKTVESHRAAAMRKAGVRSAAAFVRFAIKHNLIAA